MRARPRAPLTLEAEELRRLGHRVVDAIVDHWEGLEDLPPVRTGTPQELRARVGGPPPEAPGDAEAALDVLLADVLPFIQHGDHPRYFARVPGPSNPVGALADGLAAGMNVIAASWGGGSGPATVELVVLDWIRSWCGLPEATEGILVSGGSMATLTCLAAARAERGAGVAYVSEQTHASVLRALRILGLPEDAIRVLPSDDGFRLAVSNVADAVERDRREGRAPWCVIATAGTTNTGAIDPLPGLADLAAREDLWLHVDGAYGGPAVLAGDALAGIERADSLVLDPHKWLFQPYEAGCALVRHPGALGRAFAMSPEYLRDVAAGEVHFRDRGPQLTRGSRALKLWLTVQTFGMEAIRDGVARGIALAERAQRRVEETDGLEVVSPARLGIVCFRHVAPGASEEELDVRNAALVDRVVADGFTAPSSTILRGRTVLRMCTINPRTTDEDIDASVARIAALAGA